MTFGQWVADWSKNRPHERIGQAFVNDFIKQAFPELYYCEDTAKCFDMIYEWLSLHGYDYHNMPENI